MGGYQKEYRRREWQWECEREQEWQYRWKRGKWRGNDAPPDESPGVLLRRRCGAHRAHRLALLFIFRFVLAIQRPAHHIRAHTYIRDTALCPHTHTRDSAVSVAQVRDPFALVARRDSAARKVIATPQPVLGLAPVVPVRPAQTAAPPAAARKCAGHESQRAQWCGRGVAIHERRRCERDACTWPEPLGPGSRRPLAQSFFLGRVLVGAPPCSARHAAAHVLELAAGCRFRERAGAGGGAGLAGRVCQGACARPGAAWVCGRRGEVGGRFGG